MRTFASILVVCFGCLSAAMATEQWTPVEWNQEKAFLLEGKRWKAIVSVDRGRLVHFGPRAKPELNLLLSPADPADRYGYGGHRVWLGPQQEWPSIWPPPEAWEKSPAATVNLQDGCLVLTMPASPQGWPTLVRSYTSEGESLACGVTMVGGTKSVQVMQILRTPIETEVQIEPRINPANGETMRLLAAPEGFKSSGLLPPQGRATGAYWLFQYNDSHIKLGFAVQTLVARYRGVEWTCARGQNLGGLVDEPDGGLYTQIYLGSAKSDPVVELEQLSPRWRAGEPNQSVMILDVVEAQSR